MKAIDSAQNSPFAAKYRHQHYYKMGDFHI